MKAKVAAGIIAWSFLLSLPFICRQAYRSYAQKPSIEQRIEFPVNKQPVDYCSGIDPFRGICFFLKDDTRVIYKFDKETEHSLDQSLNHLKITELDDLYKVYINIDKNKDRIIDASEAGSLYASLSGQQ